MSNFKFRTFGNSKQNILLCDIDECCICNKLKQTLAEIKEMLQIIMETNKVYPLQTNLDKILQKINEVEDENCHFDKIKELTKEM